MLRKIPLSPIKIISKFFCLSKPSTTEPIIHQTNIFSKPNIKITKICNYEMATQKAKQVYVQPISSNNHQTLSTSSIAIQIMQSIQALTQSAQFKKKFNSFYYLQKYSWICIHTWIVLYRMRQCDSMAEIINAYLLRRKLLKLLEEYTRDQVYEYDEAFDRQIYEELKRRQESIFWALDQYFVFGLKDKEIDQIIEQDFGLWPNKEHTEKATQNEDTISKSDLFEGLQKNDQTKDYRWKKQEEMKQVGQYFLSKMSELSMTPYEKIKAGKLQQWLKL